MRMTFPNEFNEMADKIKPYLQYVEGEGLVFVEGTPKEIIEMREKCQEWIRDNEA